jgi:hypothetical protein
MKNIQFTSRESDLEILRGLLAELRSLRVLGLVSLFVLLPAVLTGVLLSDDFEGAPDMLCAEVILSIGLSLLA